MSITGAVPGGDWTQVTGQDGFSGRQGHSSVVFHDSLWVIGGLGPESTYSSQVWRSDDGKTWSMVTPSAAFGGRAGHRSAVFDGKIWVIGGRDGNTLQPLNDVWYSEDGISWTQATSAAPFAPRWNFGIAVFNDEIWVIGGSEDGVVHNDVWHSADGNTWKPATARAGFSPRMDLTATSFNGKIWVTGGFDWTRLYNDVWSSPDGVVWTRVTDHAAFPERRYQSVEVADGKMWLIGGSGGGDPYNGYYLTDVWNSEDGGKWQQVTNHTGYTGRIDFSTAVFNNRLWVIGGNRSNEVWYSDVLPARSPVSVEMNAHGPSQITVSKNVAPMSVKEGTGISVTIRVQNQGPEPVHDIEILDVPPKEFPVTSGVTSSAADAIGPGDSLVLTYTALAVKPGSFPLNRTSVLFAGSDGNYHLVRSNNPEVKVLASLISPSPKPEPGLFDGFLSAIRRTFSSR